MKKEVGQVLVIALIFLMVILITSLSLFSLISFYSRSAQTGLAKEQAFQLAEAGIEKAVWALNTEPYSGDGPITLGFGEFNVKLTTIDLSTIEVESTGFVPTALAPIAQKKIKVRVSLGTETIAFHYAAQIGEGGVEMQSNAEIFGNVYSNGDITGAANTIIDGDAKAVGTISTPYPQVTGTKETGVAVQPLPDIKVQSWKDKANQNNNPIIGDLTISNSQDLGPRKIEGNLTISGNNTKLTVKGPIHVTGNFIMNSNTELALDPSFGSSGTVIVVDGTITINSNVKIWPTTASPKGYILLVSTADSSSAIDLNSDISGGLFYSNPGTTVLEANVDVVAITAYKLLLKSNATLKYDLGLASAKFTSGTGGGWQIVKSSYQIMP